MEYFGDGSMMMDTQTQKEGHTRLGTLETLATPGMKHDTSFQSGGSITDQDPHSVTSVDKNRSGFRNDMIFILDMKMNYVLMSERLKLIVIHIRKKHSEK